MKFYDREDELNTLKKNWEQSASHSMMTTMIGRRRIGKNSGAYLGNLCDDYSFITKTPRC